MHPVSTEVNNVATTALSSPRRPLRSPRARIDRERSQGTAVADSQENGRVAITACVALIRAGFACEPVRACLAEEPIVVQPAEQHVRAGTAAKEIVAGTTQQEISARSTQDAVVSGAACCNVTIAASDDHVVASTAMQAVSPEGSKEITTRSTRHGVVASQRADQIVSSVPR